MKFKASDLCFVTVTECQWTPHWHNLKEHTKSAIRKDHLAPCRFNCWTNQISIGISQPLAQLQRRYNVEIPRVSLPDVRAKWDFKFRVRTDRVNSVTVNLVFKFKLVLLWHLEPCHPLYRSMLRYWSTSKYFDIEVSSIWKSNTSISLFNTSILKLPKNFDIEVSSISKLRASISGVKI